MNRDVILYLWAAIGIAVAGVLFFLAGVMHAFSQFSKPKPATRSKAVSPSPNADQSEDNP